MYSFFVLGQIPGTDIIITFSMWAQLAALVAACGLWMYVRRQRRDYTRQPLHLLTEATISSN